MIEQYEFRLNAFPRGFHLITDIILDKISALPDKGLVNIFIKHTSAALTINENADFTVRQDFESSFNSLVPENQPFYRHTIEGPDDMPAHIKATLCDSSVTIPIKDGKFCLGTWQGIYLCEFRNRASGRSLLITVYS